MKRGKEGLCAYNKVCSLAEIKVWSWGDCIPASVETELNFDYTASRKWLMTKPS
jgi:hypothetical protein